MRIVAAMGGESDRQARFESSNQAQEKLQLEAVLAQLLPGPVVELIAAVAVGLVLWIGGQQVFEGTIRPGELIAFMVALGLLHDPLKGIAQINTLLSRAQAGASAVFQVLDTVPAVQDHGTRQVAPGPATLRFVDVGHDYGDGPVLRRFNAEIRPGSVVSLVGASGAGKSTLAHLISRFMDPSEGHIELNGHPLQQYTLASLRGAVAVVTQDPFLFDATVTENIGFGTSATQEQIEAAAEAANAHGFIQALPGGYQTRLDELGMRLSGGQRQRICIARALLRDAPILVLDEATSALDAHTEAALQNALERLMKGRTVLCIAHRLSTVAAADEIIVLEQGRVVEQGTHESLTILHGSYHRLIRPQIGR
jgi:subfamily B ATP-binding cassette protein MsbA